MPSCGGTRSKRSGSRTVNDRVGFDTTPKLMQITRAGEYGVLGLLALARRPVGEVVMVDVIAAEEEVPVSFLGKIFQSLSRAGIVKSARGSGGGFALCRTPAEITILQVIEAIEGPISLQRCLDEDSGCEHIAGCALCGLLTEAQDRVKDVFQATTLAELAGRHLPAGLMKQARARGQAGITLTEISANGRSTPALAVGASGMPATAAANGHGTVVTVGGGVVESGPGFTAGGETFLD